MQSSDSSPSRTASPNSIESIELNRHNRKSSWNRFAINSNNDLFQRQYKHSTDPFLSNIRLLQADSVNPYLGKMTNSGHQLTSQTSTGGNCSSNNIDSNDDNNLSNRNINNHSHNANNNANPICDLSQVHNRIASHNRQFGNSTNSPSLVSHSESESPVDLHLYQFSPNSGSGNQTGANKICIHCNYFSKCNLCNSKSDSSPLLFLRDGYPSSQQELLSNKMNSLNSEVLLSPDAKHLFSSHSGGGPGMSLGGNPLVAGHIGHIGTSIAGISGAGVNPGGLSMAGSHLHPSSHHHTSHSTSLHSMTSPSFSLHSHLSASVPGQRRISSAGSTNSNRPPKNAVNTKTFLCPMCNKFFTQKGNLKTHMMIHTGDKPYACHVCGKSFTQKGNVDTHIKIHTGVKDYSCESCGKSFTQKGNLKTHLRSVHTKEKPYVCSVCGKGFSQKGNMRTHIRTHNKDDRFPCNLCGKTFSQKGNLKTHMQRHAGTLPKRYGPGGQRRQTTSRLLQVPVSAIGSTPAAAAAAAAAAYAIAAAGNANNHHDRSHQPSAHQVGSGQLNRNASISPEGGDESRSPTTSTMVHGNNSLNGGGGGGSQRGGLGQQSVISNVQNQQQSHEQQQQVASPSLYPASSENGFLNGNHTPPINTTTGGGGGARDGHNSSSIVNSLSHMHSAHNQQNSFNLATTSSSASAAAAAAAVLLSSTPGFSKGDPKTNHLHFMSSLFH